jgi:hypothetical protein
VQTETHHARLFLLALVLALLALALLPKPVHSRWLARHCQQHSSATSAPLATRLEEIRDLR